VEEALSSIKWAHSLISLPKDVSRRTIKAYAEVWGTGSSGYEYCPIAWVQAMVDPYTNSDGYRVITLQLHEDWVNKVLSYACLAIQSGDGANFTYYPHHQANANAPFQLRNVRLQDRHWNVLLSQRSAVFVDSSLVTSFVPKPVSVSGDHRITEEMSFGPRPAAMRNVSALSKALPSLPPHPLRVPNFVSCAYFALSE